ncbi:MAG: BON domain-containing protein [Acidobacteriaceae bacterium]
MMRWYPIAALAVAAFAAVTAVSQTFTVVQPKASKRSVTKVVRPGEVTVNRPANTKGANETIAKPTIKEENVSPTAGADVHARRTAKRRAVKTAGATKAPAKAAAPAPEPAPEIAAAPVAKAAPPALEPVPTLSKLSSAELQQRIESALRENANIVGAHGINVRVTDSEIRLEGTIANGQQKLEAERLAQSFGGNRLFKDQMVVAGKQ